MNSKIYSRPVPLAHCYYPLQNAYIKIVTAEHIVSKCEKIYKFI